MAAAADVQIHAGETVVLEVAIVDHDGVAKALDDAADASFILDADAPIEKTLGSGITVSGSTATVTIGDDETEELASGAYQYQLYIEDADGVVACVVDGMVIVTAKLAGAA